MASATSNRRATVEPMQGPASDVDAAVARLEALATVLDGLFVIPGTNVRIGVDAVLGLFPIVGDLLSQAISGYLIWEARRLGASRLVIWRMVANSAVDTVIGMVPVAGDAFDVVFRANKRNVALLRAHLEKKRAKQIIEGDWRRVG
ncbi:MAG: DUF4112 domain-containing protein [Hyphomicrobiaceae bacterium]|jgi:hypothetical protein